MESIIGNTSGFKSLIAKLESMWEMERKIEDVLKLKLKQVETEEEFDKYVQMLQDCEVRMIEINNLQTSYEDLVVELEA